MTRDEAYDKVVQATQDSITMRHVLVDALVAFDLLKVEEPRPRGVDVATEAHAVLQNVMTEILPRGGDRTIGCLSSYGAGCIRQALDTAGLTIVRKEDVK